MRSSAGIARMGDGGGGAERGGRRHGNCEASVYRLRCNRVRVRVWVGGLRLIRRAMNFQGVALEKRTQSEKL